MRIPFVSVCFVLGFGVATTGMALQPSEPESPPVESPWSASSRTRPLSENARALVEEARERSPIIERQLDAIEKSDLIVYVSDLMPGVFNGPKSHMVILSSDATVRYLWIRIDSPRLSPTERIGALGHELHHALEVAAAPEARDSKGLARLYRRIGWQSSPNRFESGAAQAIVFQIRKELGQYDKAARLARGAAMAVRPGGVKAASAPALGSAQP